MGMGLDRYLVTLGKKQLFATQAYKLMADGTCWCLQPVERSFPESRRLEFAGRSLNDALRWIDTLNAETPSCGAAEECAIDLTPTPAGSVPGFW